MPDEVGFDPARIARLRDPARLEQLDPEKVWSVLSPPEAGTLVDIGAGVGYLTLPMARRLQHARVVGCDILPGMLELLAEAADEEGLTNVETVLMEPARVPLEDGAADQITMVQVHHELDEPEALLAECHRLLRPGGVLAIIDWNERHTGRWVAEATLRGHVSGAGFRNLATHPIYPNHHFLTAER